MTDAINYMPPMLVGNELKEALSVYPPYAVAIRKGTVANRLILCYLSSIYLRSINQQYFAFVFLGLIIVHH